jgi:alpha-N-arabinofuranosidase
MGPLIKEVTAICDAVAAKRKSAKRVHLSYDEWNVWRGDVEDKNDAWSVAPSLLEDVYTLADALCVGAMIITLLNNCDRVKIACLAQLVNVIGPIMTRTGGPAWRQTIFYPFAHAAQLASGSVLRTVTNGATYKAGGVDVSIVTSCLIWGDDGSLTVLAVNRDLEQPATLELDLRSFPQLKMEGWLVLDGDLTATNTDKQPERVMPRAVRTVRTDERPRVSLSKGSWNVIRFSPAAGK